MIDYTFSYSNYGIVFQIVFFGGQFSLFTSQTNQQDIGKNNTRTNRRVMPNSKLHTLVKTPSTEVQCT